MKLIRHPPLRLKDHVSELDEADLAHMIHGVLQDVMRSVVAQLASSLKKYDEDEARDEQGRWTSGGLSQRVEAGRPLPAHIEALRIPPAWTDVHYNPDPNGKLLVMGKDAKGRRQPIYNLGYLRHNAENKFARIEELRAKADRIDKQIVADQKDPAKGEHADAARLIMQTGIRPGSERDTGGEKRAYGATTFEGRHVVTEGGKTYLQFTGKKGVDLNIPVTDKAVASMLQERAGRAGASGKLFPGVSDSSLRDYVHSLNGGGFKTKDFRTLLGTRLAMAQVEKMPAPKDAKSYQRAVMAVAKTVSSSLGNTPTVALQAYINPVVFSSWRMAAGG